MRNLTRIFLTLTVSMLLAAVCAAQQGGRMKKPNKGRTRPATSQPAAPSREVVVVVDPGKIVVPTEVREVGNATINYYGTKDKTDVSLALLQVYEHRQVPLQLFCGFEVAGKEVVRPESVRLQLTWDPAEFRKGMRLFRRGGSLAIEADGRQFNFEAELGRCPQRAAGVDVCDSMHARVDFASFEQILNSKSVKVRAEPHVFELSETHLDALRDLLRAIKSPAGKP